MKKAKSLLALILAMLIAFGGTVCAFAADPAEAEPNNAITTATELNLDKGIKGKISDANDEDYYALTVAESGLITVSLAHDVKTSADPVMPYFVATALSADGETEIDSVKSAGTDSKVSFDFSVNAGVYYIKVEMGNVLDETLEYTLTAKINKTALIEKEPNDTTSQATTLKLSKKGETNLYYGAITDGDVDYYAVTFDAPSLATFGIYNTASKNGNYTATLIKIVDGINGETLPKEVGVIEIKDGETVKDSPLLGVNGGKYYLKVEGVGASTGGYQVRVYAGSSNSTDEYEYNNIDKYANLLNAGKYFTGNIFADDDLYKDVDVFKFKAPKKNNGYDIVLADYDGKKDVVNGQWTIEVTNENGDVINAKTTVLNTETVTVSTDVLAEGTYYITITAGNVFTGETYKVSLTEKKKSEVKDDKDDGITSFDEFIANIKAVDWSGFWKNFEGWFEYINIIGIVQDIMPGIISLLSDLVFSKV